MEGTADEILYFINDLSDWVRACYRASVPAHIFNAIAGDEARPSGEQFIVRRFTPEMSLKTVTKLSSDWHEAVANNLSGPLCEFPEPWCGAARSCGYDILPIPNAAELYREGHAMHHCVGTHSGRARTGDAYFYSIRKDNERIATLELVRVGRRVAIGQLRGPCNGQVPKTVARVVNTWLMSQREFRLPKSWEPFDDEMPF